jgi:hypothetical protein
MTAHTSAIYGELKHSYRLYIWRPRRSDNSNLLRVPTSRGRNASKYITVTNRQIRTSETVDLLWVCDAKTSSSADELCTERSVKYMVQYCAIPLARVAHTKMNVLRLRVTCDLARASSTRNAVPRFIYRNRRSAGHICGFISQTHASCHCMHRDKIHENMCVWNC